MGRPKSSGVAGYDSKGQPVYWKTSQQLVKGKNVTFTHCFYCEYKNQNSTNVRKHILNVWPCKRKNEVVKAISTTKKEWIEVKGMTRSQVDEMKLTNPTIVTGNSENKVKQKPNPGSIKKRSPHKKEWIEIKGLTRQQVNQLTTPSPSSVEPEKRQATTTRVYSFSKPPQQIPIPSKPKILNFHLTSPTSSSASTRVKIVSIVDNQDENME